MGSHLPEIYIFILTLLFNSYYYIIYPILLHKASNIELNEVQSKLIPKPELT